MPTYEYDYDSARKELTDVFLSAVKDDFEFNQALDIVRDYRNVGGKRFLISSFVYRTLIKAMHNPSLANPDELDFLVGRHKPLYEFILPPRFLLREPGRRKKHNLVDRNNRTISFSTFSTFHSIAQGAMKGNIDSYLNNVPFNINSIAFDLETNKILGFAGVEAVYKGVIKINNPTAARYFAEKHREKSLEEHLRQKAESLRIRYE